MSSSSSKNSDEKSFNIVILTDNRYVDPKETNEYIANVLLEDQIVLDALQNVGLKVARKSWDDKSFDWSTTKHALFRTTWDYFDRYEEFFKWFQKTATQTQFINSEHLIRWNIDKHYLQDLGKNGVHIPKTLFIEASTKTTLSLEIKKAKQTLGFHSSEFVLKPCISGAARHTYKFHESKNYKHEAIFQELIANEAMMLQEFQKNIVDEGEVSMMIFNGQFTHAILKLAKPGDFRVQDDYGGSVHQYKPSAMEISFAENVVKAAPELSYYARVDIFKDNEGQLALAELEIFEPELWFRFYPKAAGVLARSIKNKLF